MYMDTSMYTYTSTCPFAPLAALALLSLMCIRSFRSFRAYHGAGRPSRPTTLVPLVENPAVPQLKLQAVRLSSAMDVRLRDRAARWPREVAEALRR